MKRFNLWSWLAILGMAVTFSANAAEFLYTGAAGDFCYYTPGNWQGDIRPQTGDTARIADGTFQIIYTTKTNARDGFFDVTDGIDLTVQNAVLNVVPSPAGYARLYATGGTTMDIDHSTVTSDCEILAGWAPQKDGTPEGGPGTFHIYNGSTVLSKRYTVALGYKAGVSGTLHLGKTGETEASTLTSWDQILVGNAGSGTLTTRGISQMDSTGNLSIGAEGTGNGTMTVNDASGVTSTRAVLVGNKGTGELTINDNAVVRSLSNTTRTKKDSGDLSTSGGIILGYQAGSSGTVTVNGGLLEAGTATFDGTPETYSVIVGNQGTGTLHLNGGEVHATNQILAGMLDGSVGTLNMKDGLLNSSNGIYFGIFEGSKGYGNIMGGTIQPNGNFYLADGTGSYGEVRLSGNTVLEKTNYFTVGHMGTGKMTVGGSASLTISNDVRVGNSANSSGTLTLGENATMNVAGQIIVAENADSKGEMTIQGNAAVRAELTTIGRSAGSKGILNINGGTTNLTNMLIIGGTLDSTLAPTATGTVNVNGGSISGPSWTAVGGNGNGTLNLRGGTFLYPSITIAGRTAQSTGTMLLDGGTLKCNYIVIAEAGNAALTLKSGTFTDTNGSTGIRLLFYSGASATLNIVGENHGNDWTVGLLEVNAAAKPRMNFLAGYNDGGIAKLTANNTSPVTFHGGVKIGMEYPFGFLNASEFTVLETPGTTLSLTGAKDESLFAVTTPNDNKIVGTLQNISEGDYSIGDTFVLSAPGKSGAVHLSGASVPENFELAFDIVGLEDTSGLASWLDTAMTDVQVDVRPVDSAIVLENIAPYLVNGWLAWDFSGYAGDFRVTGLSSREVPEPASWGLLLLGLLVLFRRKRRTA